MVALTAEVISSKAMPGSDFGANKNLPRNSSLLNEQHPARKHPSNFSESALQTADCRQQLRTVVEAFYF